MGVNMVLENDKQFCQLCIEIAEGNISSSRFSELLIQTGVTLDESEWATANQILGRSEVMQSIYNVEESALQ
jgi:hypothetical protein